MKKFTFILILAVASLLSNQVQGAVYPVNPGEDVAAVLRPLGLDGTSTEDVIIELQAEGEYQWLGMVSTEFPKNITVRAKPGLAKRPVIKSDSDFAFIFPRNRTTNDNPGAKGIYTFQGIEFDGTMRTPLFFSVELKAGNIITVNMDNCVVKLAPAPNGRKPLGFTYNNNSGQPTQGDLTITNSLFLFDGEGAIIRASGNGRPKSLTMNNCFIKGKYQNAAIENRWSEDNSLDLEMIDINHCTFEGNSGLDVVLRGPVDLQNTIFSNNTYTGANDNFLGTGGNLLNSCAWYNSAKAELFAEGLYDELTLRTDPKYNEFGFATAADYMSGGNDGHPIGFYEADGLTKTTLPTSVRNVVYNKNMQIISLGGNNYQLVGVANGKYNIYNVAGQTVANGIVQDGKLTFGAAQKGVYILVTDKQSGKFIVQ